MMTNNPLSSPSSHSGWCGALWGTYYLVSQLPVCPNLPPSSFITTQLSNVVLKIFNTSPCLLIKSGSLTWHLKLSARDSTQLSSLVSFLSNIWSLCPSESEQFPVPPLNAFAPTTEFLGSLTSLLHISSLPFLWTPGNPAGSNPAPHIATALGAPPLWLLPHSALQCSDPSPCPVALSHYKLPEAVAVSHTSSSSSVSSLTWGFRSYLFADFQLNMMDWKQILLCHLLKPLV